MNILKISKQENRYYVSGNMTPPKWIPLPETLKSRADIKKYYKGADLKFCNALGQHCREYSVYYFYKAPPGQFSPQISKSGIPIQLMAVEDQNKKLVIDLPVTAKQDEIENWLLSRAKNEGFESGMIEYKEELLD